MLDFELIDDNEDLLQQYKTLLNALTDCSLSEAEEDKLQKMLNNCEIEVTKRMNGKCQNESK